jgi:hypothetical protein
MVNQDPYPAIPGEYVKVLFQVSGLQASECGTIDFWLHQEFPFILDPGVDNHVLVKSGTYTTEFGNYFLVPYKLRVDSDAIDGDNKLEVRYSTSGAAENFYVSEEFDINVEDSRTDFEIYIKDYSYITKKAVFEILNIGESNVEGLTLEILKQDNIKIYGANRVIIGDLNSNEEDSATFEADLKEGLINVRIYYTDQIGERRLLEKKVEFDPAYFNNITEEAEPFNPILSFIIGVVLVLILVLIRNKLKKRKEKKLRKKKNSVKL